MGRGEKKVGDEREGEERKGWQGQRDAQETTEGRRRREGRETKGGRVVKTGEESMPLTSHLRALPASQLSVLAARILTDRPYGFIMRHTHTHMPQRTHNTHTHTFEDAFRAHTHTHSGAEGRGQVRGIEWRERGGGGGGGGGDVMARLSFFHLRGLRGRAELAQLLQLTRTHTHTHICTLHTQSRTPILGKLGEYNHHHQMQAEQIFGAQKCKSHSLYVDIETPPVGAHSQTHTCTQTHTHTHTWSGHQGGWALPLWRRWGWRLWILCSHRRIKHLTQITVISVRIQWMDDPGHESPRTEPGAQWGPSPGASGGVVELLSVDRLCWSWTIGMCLCWQVQSDHLNQIKDTQEKYQLT